MIPKIAIIGYGFVGKAVHSAFSNCKILIVDPILGKPYNELDSFEPDYTFICVPTPSREDGSIDVSALFSSISYVLNNTYSRIIIKSTVIPELVEDIIRGHYERIVYNPEFLTESNSFNDMITNDIILGGDKFETDKIEKLYKEFSKCNPKEYYHCSAYEASWIKYMANTMLAMKVAILTQFKDAVSDDISWQHIIKILQNDSRLGSSHWQIPGPDGKLGFGGSCFPKDCNALLNITDKLTILKTAVDYNNSIRSNYERSDREQKQNITF